MLNITTLATRWGKEFGGVNEVDAFRATTLPTRANSIATLYNTAALQRLVTSTLYTDTQTASDLLGTGIVTTYLDIASATLIQMSLDDVPTELPPNPTTIDYLNKLVTDMLAQSQTFQKPTVTINSSATFASATPVTTVIGAPFGNGAIIGTVIDPSTGNPRLYVFEETLKLVCIIDSYTGGITAGTETFSLNGELALDTLDANWPGGSGASTTVQGQPSRYSTLFGNAYFLNWTSADVNVPDDWLTSNLIPGTTLFRTTDSYTGIVGEYAAQLTAAILNAELYQTLSTLTGSTNYGVAIRIKRVTNITGGVLTIGLRNTSGTYYQDALGNDLKKVITLTGSSGSYLLFDSVFSMPRGFSGTPVISLKITTAMNAAETINLATVEFIPMTPAYANGPDVVIFPGSVSFADNDTYTLAMANSADTTTFVGNLNRLYDISTLGVLVPVAASPTQSDSLIS